MIGGGVTGASAAYHLAKAGAGVTLVERHDLNTQASGRNAGGLHGQIQLEPFLLKGEQWAREFGPSLASDASRDPLLAGARAGARGRPRGERLRRLIVAGGRRAAARPRAQGRDRERLRRRGRAARPRRPRARRAVRRRTEWPAACSARSRAAPTRSWPHRRSGAPPQRSARACCRGRWCTRSNAGTAASASRRAPARSTATGSSTAPVPRPATWRRLAGAAFEVERWPLMVSATEPAPPLVEHLVYFAGGRLTLKQARRGTLLIGGGWPARVDDRTGRLLTDFAGLAENLRFAIEVVPEVAGSSLLRTWQGVCPGPRRTSGPRSASSCPGSSWRSSRTSASPAGRSRAGSPRASRSARTSSVDLSPFAPSRLL